jgi:lipase chaperone LimK
MKRRWPISFAIAFAGVGGLAALWRLEAPVPPSRVPASGLVRSSTARIEVPEQAAPLVGPLPASLQGTAVDGDLPTNARGDLVVGPQVRRFFDYFLTASGEEPMGTIRHRILSEIRQRLPSTTANQAIDLLDRYLTYRERAAVLGPGDPNDLEARLAALEALRREVLGGHDAVALFGDEEDASRAALERRRIAEDPRLSAEAKERALEKEEARLPEPEREARAEAVSALRLWQDEQQLRADGASPQEIRERRESRFGKEAADRLEELDRAGDAWRDRIDRYQHEKTAIDSDPSLNGEQRARAVDQLLQESFSSTEQIRVHAILGDPAAPPP